MLIIMASYDWLAISPVFELLTNKKLESNGSP